MSALRTVKVAIAVALALCSLAAVELGWRAYGLGLAIDVERQFPPLSAEAMSSKAAPLLRAASNADAIYAVVQTQHVDLQQKHDFVLGVAASARETALIGLVCVGLTAVLLLFAYRRLGQLPLANNAGCPSV